MLGWAHDPERPLERLELEVEIDGEPLGRHVADRERKDLLRAGIGDGKHAFRVELPTQLEPGSEHTIAVRALSDGTRIPLARDYFADMTGDPQAAKLNLTVDGIEPEAKATDGATGDEDEEFDLDEVPRPDRLAVEPLVAPAAVRPRALLGHGGWLFAFESREQLARSLGLALPSPERVAEQLAELRERHGRLSSLGVGYLPVTVPEKSAVYPEHLPAGVAFDRQARPAAHLFAVLRDESRLEALDLLGALLDARRHGRTYLRQGTRLTWTGAYFAYRAIVKELAKRFGAVEPAGTATLALGNLVENSELLQHRERVTVLGRELISVLPSNEAADSEPDLIRDGFEAMFVPVPPALGKQLSEDATLLELAPGTNRPTAVIVHDGSGERLVPFLAEHFARTVVEVADQPSYGLIEQERPLVVVQIIGEASPFFA